MYCNMGKTKLIGETDIEVYDKLSFKRFVKEKRRDIQDDELSRGNRKYYPLEKMAANLGLSVEMLQKRINKQKPARSRDCIIAICASLGCDSEDTEKALRMYDYMPSFDPVIPREFFLKQMLDKLRGEPADICIVNKQLKERNYPELDIIDHKCKVKDSDDSPNGYYPYRVLRKTVRTYLDTRLQSARTAGLASLHDNTSTLHG